MTNAQVVAPATRVNTRGIAGRVEANPSRFAIAPRPNRHKLSDFYRMAAPWLWECGKSWNALSGELRLHGHETAAVVRFDN
jgi:hypothetical protein